MIKLFKKADKKLIIALLTIIVMLSTFLIYKIYAATVTKEMTSTGTGLANGTVGAEGSLYLEDLYNRYDILCCSKGTALRSSGSGATTVYRVASVNEASPMEAYILAEMVNDVTGFSTSDIVFDTDSSGNKKEFTDLESLDNASAIAFEDKTIYVITSQEVEEENGTVNEEDSGIGTETLVMQDEDGKYYYVTTGTNSGYGVYSYVQRAWWNTEAGGKGNSVPPNELSTEAEQFEAYINQFGEYEITEQTITDENGNEKTVPAPDLNFEADFNGKDTTVSWDRELRAYLIGPISIDYIEASSNSTGRETVMFSGINNFEVYTDDSNEPLILGEDWEFYWQNRDSSDDAKYPHTGEEFYIKLDYDDVSEATKVTDIKVEFKYMNAGGKYEDLKGKYYVETEEGTIERESQALAGGLIGARWYETEEITWGDDLHQGRIRINKIVVDEDGEEITSFDENVYFGFKVTIDGKTQFVRVKAGSAAMTDLYTWEGNKAPEYKVEEIDIPQGYEVKSITPDEGILENGEIIDIEAINEISNEGTIRIVKKITKTSTRDQDFAINVKVTGTFKYNGMSYRNKTLTIPVKVRVPAGEKTGAVLLKGFKWDAGDAPKYSVTEDEDYNTLYELQSINPKKGTLKENKETTITVINRRGGSRNYDDKVRLKIIKTLENADAYDKDYIESLEFKFKIDVEGHGTNYIKIRPIRDNNTYIWSYISDYYYIDDGEILDYTIEEIDIPEGIEFLEANCDDSEVDVSGQKIKGTLEDTDGDGKVTVNVINTGGDAEKGRLKITKVINDEALTNQDYVFKVKVTGTFEYNGASYEDETLEISTPILVRVQPGQTEASTLVPGEFTWNGEAPTYKVEEDMNGLGRIQGTINPGEGSLRKGETVEVIAENRTSTSKKGSLRIVKVLEDSGIFSDEYIKSLTFKFKITVGGRDYGTVSLNAEKVNGSYIWQHTSDYTWSDGEEAPTYTIEEVDLPAGTEFVSATSSNGTASGMSITGKLIPDSEDSYVVENNFINKLKTPGHHEDPEDPTGYLKIQKKVLDESLRGKSFKFNIKLKGTFEYNGATYNNTTLEIPDIEVAGGSTWCSSQIKWFGTNAPTYVVEEQASDIATLESVINASGTLAPGNETKAQTAIFTNSTKKSSGTIQITKKLEDGATSDETFYFDIEVEGYEKFTIGVKAGETYRSEAFTWDSANEAPKYTVTEIDSTTANFVSISNGTDTSTSKSISGSLEKDGIINIVCINKLNAHSGKLKVTKRVVVDEKLQEEAIDSEFTINIVINGTFEMNGESVIDSRTITQTLKAGESFETPEIKWYGETAPTYIVTETSIPEGWTLENISNGEGQLFADTTTESVVTNKLSSRVELDLTIDMAGHVWEDTEVDNKEVEQVETYGIQGIYDEKIEKGIDGVEVYIYKVVYDANMTELYRELGKAYAEDSNTKVSFPVYTKNGGYWASPRMSVPIVTPEEQASGYTAAYDVEFIYDGQTYEPTTLLKTSNGDANAYRAATTSKRDAWAKDSMALDYNRDEVNSRISQVMGETEIDSDGSTIGKAIDAQGNENALYYKAVDYTEGLSSSRKISELQTKDSKGNIYDIYKTKARTSNGGLTYPFDNRYHLESIDKYIDNIGIVERYKYTATYNYTLNINLGLLKRDEADMGTTKDLYSAKVIANEKALNYKFNTLADLTGTTITRQLQADEINVSYDLGLYKTDYYYRAELYQTNGKMYDAVETFYKTLGKEVKDTELDVYLTYKIKLYNESPNYIVSINSVNDYFDSSFGKPVTEVETKYIQTSDGVTVDAVTEVANKSYVETSSGAKFDINWEVKEQNIKGSDGITYNKMVANFGTEALRLASGEKAEITVTFKVQKDDNAGVKEAIILGQKANVAEIANYTTYYQDGKLAGKIDRDSAPANVNIVDNNTRNWYEDDTDSAPILNLSISGEEREIDGIAWEDKPDTTLEHNQKVGNGVYDSGEALIGGLTTQLIEKVMVKNPGSETEYTEYDFLWPTNRPLDILGGRTLQSLTGFDSTIETSRTQSADTEGLDLGEYRFEGVPAGNYVVRFLYGNDKTELADSEGITGDATALKLDGSGNVVNYSENEKVLTANYDDDLEGKTPSIYSGHDFKTTTYQTGFAVKNGEGYLINEWHNLNLSGTRISDARDSEPRRLETIANSTTITNVNGEVLGTANDAEANHTNLFKDYYMFADTAKINVNVEDILTNTIVDTETLKNANIPSGIEVKVVNGTVLKDSVLQTSGFVYRIKDIDIGLEERSETNIVLDKQISSIKLTTSDGTKIFDVMYDISYEEISTAEYVLGNYTKVLERDGKVIVAKISLNPNSIGADTLQSINKFEDKDKIEGRQNFRYINVDNTILQGSTIEVNYQMTALNVSEVDRADSKLVNIDQVAIANGTTIAEELLKAATEIERNNSSYTKAVGATNFNSKTKVGTYLGTTYYQGPNADGKDEIVTVRVRQLVDYVDNDAVFTAAYNNGVDSSWRNISINEITGNGFDENRLINKEIIRENDIKDKSGVFYITDQKNNLIVSVDSTEDNPTLTNKGFEVKLMPYDVDSTKYSSRITLKTTRTVAAESDADSLAFDNLAEIIKYDIPTGRRDVTTVPGNANPKYGEFISAIDERDSSATEIVTLTPPTGIETGIELTLQILAVSVIGLAIIAIGIIVIKKKVLTK